MRTKELEEGKKLNLDFGKLRRVANKCPKVIPVVVQDWQTGEVLLLAYANEQALRETLKKGVAVFWSTSRGEYGELWVKGETSGCFLEIKEVRVNCDQNSLLYLVEKPEGIGACHTEDESGGFRESCFYRKITDWANGKLVFVQLRKDGA
ncbi:MAG: phosphoribosyl-AMP cyclohydrolase [Patescibacteria group bacterium]|nr:phosphoribosyl-AMP cyclohydrolase [Patescibacteria group bacterium]